MALGPPIDFEVWKPQAQGRAVVVGNGPVAGCLGEMIDDCDFVVRINLFVCGPQTGWKTDLVFVNAGALSEVRLPELPVCTVAVAATPGSLRQAAADRRAAFIVGPARLKELRNRVGVASDKELLTGLVAAVELLDRGYETHLFGFDVFAEGVRYHASASSGEAACDFTQRHELATEARFLLSHPAVFCH